MGDANIVYIVDDNAEVRDSIAALLASKGLSSRCYSDAKAFLDGCPPDAAGCLVLDVRMPGPSGLDLQRRLRERGCSLPVIMITGHGEVPMAVRALKAGALDFIEKPFTPSALVAAVNRGLAISAGATAQRREEETLRARRALLTEREFQVLKHVAKGHYNKVIADELGIAVSTVEAHRKNIMRKLRAQSLFDLVRVADLDTDR